MFYFGSRLEVGFESRIGVEAVCLRCQHRSFSVVSAAGQGTGHSAYMMDDDGAERRARREASRALVADALDVRAIAQCPQCRTRDSQTVGEFKRRAVLSVVGIAVVFSGISAVFLGYDFTTVGYAFALFGFASVLGLAASFIGTWRGLRSRCVFCPRPPVFAEANLVAEDERRQLRAFTSWAPKPKTVVLRGAQGRLEPGEKSAPPSAVPASNGHRSRSLLLSLAVPLLMAAVVLIANMVLVRAQTLYLTNGCAVSARIIVGDRSVALASGEMAEMRWLSEGSYPVQVKMDNGHSYSRTIRIQNGILQRFNFEKIFIFDVLGAQALMRYEIQYRDAGAGAAGAFPRDSLLLGQEFYSLKEVDYPFTTPPRSISQRDSRSTSRVQIERLQMSPTETLILTRGALNPGPEFVLQYVEGQLLGGLQDSSFIEAFAEACGAESMAAGCEGVLMRIEAASLAK